MSARCEKHAAVTDPGPLWPSIPGAAYDPGPGECHDCQAAEALAQETIRQEQVDLNDGPGKIFSTEPVYITQAREDAIAALHIRKKFQGKVVNFGTMGAAFAEALTFVTNNDAPILWENFLRAARITFIASPAGPTTESMEKFA